MMLLYISICCISLSEKKKWIGDGDGWMKAGREDFCMGDRNVGSWLVQETVLDWKW